MTIVQGECAPELAAVREAFEQNFRDGVETGASLVVYHRGEKVVDLHGGHRDHDRRTPWTRDTLVMPYSVCKPLVAFTVLTLVERGELDLDQPVARYWPEFAGTGKRGITTRDVLDHIAGVPAIRSPITVADLCDWPTMIGLLEQQGGWWAPRTSYCEQVSSYGHVLGEIVQRVTGRSFAEVFRERVADPLGIDFWFGVPAEEHDRCADLSGLNERDRSIYLADKLRAAFVNPPGLFDPDVVNSSSWRSASIPALNGHGTADAVAKIFALLANGGSLGTVRLLSPARASAIWQDGRIFPDMASRKPKRISHGFLDLGRGDFGSGGVGGSCGYGNHRRQLAIAYLTKAMSLGFAREERVSAALGRALAIADARRWARRIFSFPRLARGG